MEAIVNRNFVASLRQDGYGRSVTIQTETLPNGVSGFAPGFLDATIHTAEGPEESLRQVLAQHFVYPIAGEAAKIQNGGRLCDETPMSAILFGPPGTSKTELAKIISGYLKWPLLSVDPSYLVKEGVDKIQTMANKLFGAMAMAE